MTFANDLPIRDDLRGFEPYGAPEIEVPIPLNLNENPHRIPEPVAQEIVAALASQIVKSNRYPDRDFESLRQGFADYLGHSLSFKQVWAANGSNEILQQVLLAFGGPGRKVLGFPPSYSMYPILARGTFTDWVAGERAEDFELTKELAVAAIESQAPDVIFFCSPNNPTGTPLSLEVIEAAYSATKGIVVVDEAYAEFCPPGTRSALELLPGRERLLVCRTMSKAFAFAGVRVGYLAADERVIDALRLVRLPYHLSVLTQAAATAALKHVNLMLDSVTAVTKQRDRILAELPKLGFKAYQSWTNFVLFGNVNDPKSLFESLLERGILIRDVGLPGHLRVTAGTAYETDVFLSAVAELTGQ